jgi:hypothetical protein
MRLIVLTVMGLMAGLGLAAVIVDIPAIIHFPIAAASDRSPTTCERCEMAAPGFSSSISWTIQSTIPDRLIQTRSVYAVNESWLGKRAIPSRGCRHPRCHLSDGATVREILRRKSTPSRSLKAVYAQPMVGK